MNRHGGFVRSRCESLVVAAEAATSNTGEQFDLYTLLGYSSTTMFNQDARNGDIVLEIRVPTDSAITDGRIRYKFFDSTQVADVTAPIDGSTAGKTGGTVEEGESILTYALGRYLLIYGEGTAPKFRLTRVR